MIGVDTIKALIYGRLKKVTSAGPGYIHFDAAADDEYFDQLTSEVSVTKLSQGRRVHGLEAEETRRPAGGAGLRRIRLRGDAGPRRRGTTGRTREASSAGARGQASRSDDCRERRSASI
jgi:hypothetical protein